VPKAVRARVPAFAWMTVILWLSPLQRLSCHTRQIRTAHCVTEDTLPSGCELLPSRLIVVFSTSRLS